MTSGLAVAVDAIALASSPAVGSKPRSRNLDPYFFGLIVALGYTVLSFLRFYSLDSGIDLAIFTQAAQSYSELGMPSSTLKAQADFNLLGDHFSPVLMILGPLYYVVPSILGLLVVQAILVGLGAAIVARVGIEICGYIVGMCGGFVYAAAWATQGLALFDFHEVSFALPILALVYARILQGRDGSAVWWATSLMLVKEDSVFLVLGISLILLYRRKFRLGIGLMAYAAASFAVIVYLVTKGNVD
jgi:uncharacterized membrane protein